MKFILLLSILFFWNAVEASTGTVVLDIAGKKLQPHVDYHILPVIRGRGGGLTLAARNGSCPFNVAQEKLEVSNGLPMTFLPVNSKDKVVSLSSDMNAVFSASTVCVQSTVWRLGDVDKVTGKRYVTTGGVTGNPGLSTVSNWFKIEKYNDDYKLVFCPSVCNFCKVICGDVGVLNEGGKRWLGLSDVPFPVMFKKARK
ncbi:kunitz trypsin inhibitor 5 [Magnolia sinica]|uniref:kunitz trypsin inhibitor 5 n=1 Tax=Magnolia sinica TaxID=86752 RepID=UPI00265A4DF6|nr:kunitz trypsin inhibitor 5 [Magnolia sinica]